MRRLALATLTTLLLSYYTTCVATQLVPAAVSEDGTQPVYLRIALSIVRMCVREGLSNDAQLPSIHEIATHYRTTRRTAGEVYRHLANAHVIKTQHGAATRLRSQRAARDYLTAIANRSLQTSVSDLTLLGNSPDKIGELSRTLARQYEVS